MGHAITFAQQKGGSGKTTVLAHLAAAWAEAGRTVALIDLDPQQSLTRWARLRADPGIAVARVEGLPRRRRHQGRAQEPTTSCSSTAPAPPRACSRTRCARATWCSPPASRR